MRRRLLAFSVLTSAALLASVAALAAGSAAPGAATWQSQRLSVQGAGYAPWSSAAKVAVSANGTAVVSWSTTYGDGPSADSAAYVSVRRGPHGAWSKPTTIPDWQGEQVTDLVALGDGRFAAKSIGRNSDGGHPDDRLYVSDSSGSSWRRVPAPTHARLRLLARPNGSLLVVADRPGGAAPLFAVLPRGADRVGAERPMPPAARALVAHPDDRDMQVNARGDVLGVWPGKFGPTGSSLTVSVLPAAGNTWQKPVVLSTSAGTSADYHDTALTADDRFALAWSRYDKVGSTVSVNIYYSEQQASGRWLAPQRATTPKNPERDVNELPRLVFGPKGPVISYCHDGDDRSTRVTHLDDGKWLPPLTLSEPGCIGGSTWFHVLRTAQHVIATATPGWRDGWGWTATALRFDPFAKASTHAFSGRNPKLQNQELRAVALVPFGHGALAGWIATADGSVNRPARIAVYDDGRGWQTRTLCNCPATSLQLAASAASGVAVYERWNGKDQSGEIWVASSS